MKRIDGITYKQLMNAECHVGMNNSGSSLYFDIELKVCLHAFLISMFGAEIGYNLHNLKLTKVRDRFIKILWNLILEYSTTVYGISTLFVIVYT